jgi:carboxymethylenebutenolidase
MAHSSRVGPGVVVLPEFFGIQESFKAYADDLNDAGFTVLAVDPYDGVVADSVADANERAQALDTDRTMRTMRAAVRHLSENWHPRVGAVGFSLGAAFVGELACEGLLDAAVLYYGVPDVGGRRWTPPVLGHFAESDSWESVSDARSVFGEIARDGVEAELHVYPGTRHWFANQSVTDDYDRPAAELAAERTIEWLRRHLA